MRNKLIIAAIAAGVALLAQIPRPGTSPGGGGTALVAGTDYAKPGLYDTYANIAAAACTSAEAGRTARTSTTPTYSATCNGSAWQWSYGGHAVTPPPSTGWSWSNQNSATADTSTGALLLSNVLNNGTGASVYYRTQPATPYTTTFLVEYSPHSTNYYNYGVGFFESGTSKARVFGPTFDSAVAITGRWRDAVWSSLSVIGSSTDYTGVSVHGRQYRFVQLANDGTTISLKAGSEYGQWRTIFSVVKTANFTTAPDSICILMAKNNSTLTNDYVAVYSLQ